MRLFLFRHILGRSARIGARLWFIRLAASLSMLFVPPVLQAQGTITFATYRPGLVDARVRYPDGTLVSSGFTAQLYGGPAGTSVDQLIPLFPTTRFRTATPEEYGYVIEQGAVFIPGVFPGGDATLIMRAYNGLTWETSLCRGESAPFTTYTGGATAPPAPLIGLRGFTVYCIPEPTPVALGGCGLILLWFWRSHNVVAVNASGDAVVGFSCARANEYIGAVWWGRRASGAITASPVLLQSGRDYHTVTDGVIILLPFQTRTEMDSGQFKNMLRCRSRSTRFMRSDFGRPGYD